MKIATISLNQIWEDKKANMGLCEKFIRESSDKSADLVIFPELTLTGFSSSSDLLSENICNYFNDKTETECINVRLSNSYGSPVFKENNC